MASKSCPKCNSSMAEGFVIDQTHGGTALPSWVEGRPQRSVWTGLRLGGKPRLDISTWRCGRCGFLEHYAAGESTRIAERQKRAVLVAVIVTVLLIVVVSAVVVLVSPS